MSSPLIERLFRLTGSSRQVLADDGQHRPFAEVLERAVTIARHLRGEGGLVTGDRVALLASPGVAWVEAFLGIVLAGGIAVPLSPSYPPSELAWFGADAGARHVILSRDQEERGALLAGDRAVFQIEELGRIARAAAAVAEGGAVSPDVGARAELPAMDAGATALLLYTSGTTGKPKGAMITHANVATQAEIMGEAWGISAADTLLHALPLHHLHGLGISLLNALLAGTSIQMLPRFEARRVWDEIAAGRATIWMAVPTMYQKLFEALDAVPADVAARWKEGAARLRLATSGSAALPVRLAERWRALTGAIPLERFGMTEIGVGLTNPLDPKGRRPGWVGRPPRTVEIRVVDEEGRDVASGQGELLVRGPSVFAGYWQRADATTGAFREGWFATGDRAERDAGGDVRLLGRTSVDILKSGGYKLSALEIEETLREHGAVREVAVVGLPDETWGDRVVAAVVAEPGREAELSTEAVRAWAKERLAAYKIPREVVVMPALPRNALGKVVKPEVVALLSKRA
jgi:malonyl-CoA/methylmalonyl-CoA synthetase